MKRVSVLKQITACLVSAFAVASAFALTACNNSEGQQTVEKSGVAVCNAIEGIEKTEYVFCISKKTENYQTYLDAINAAIDAKNVEVDIINKYMNREDFYRYYFLNEITIENQTATPLNIYTSVCTPFAFGGAYGSGADGVDMYLWVMAANSLKMRPVFYDWGYQASYNAVKNGKGDVFATAVAKTEALSADFHLSKVYSTGYQQIVSDKNEAFTKISQLKGKKIGVIAGRPSETLIDNAIKNGELKGSGAELLVFDTDAEAYDNYKLQGCDVVVADEYSAKAMLTSK